MMKKRESIISYLEYKGIDELPGADRRLAEEAVAPHQELMPPILISW